MAGGSPQYNFFAQSGFLITRHPPPLSEAGVEEGTTGRVDWILREQRTGHKEGGAALWISPRNGEFAGPGLGPASALKQ